MSKSNRNTGLRFLWIPGRKNHQHKGRYDTTNKGNIHSPHHQKKMEPWSLGGSRGHAELIKSEDVLGEPSGSAMVSSLGAVGSAIGSASAVSATIDSRNSTEQLNGNAPTQPIDSEIEHDVHNTSTLLADEKRNGVRKKNLDSIERFDDHNSDELDAAKFGYLDLPKVPFHGGNTMVHSDQNKSTKKNDDEDCTVKCLYYGLMCCECSIS